MNQRSGDRQASIQQPRKTKLLSCSPTKLKELHGGRATTDAEPFLSRKTSLLSAPTMKSLGGSESENTPGKQPPQSYLGGLNRWSLGVGRVYVWMYVLCIVVTVCAQEYTAYFCIFSRIDLASLVHSYSGWDKTKNLLGSCQIGDGNPYCGR